MDRKKKKRKEEGDRDRDVWIRTLIPVKTLRSFDAGNLHRNMVSQAVQDEREVGGRTSRGGPSGWPTFMTMCSCADNDEPMHATTMSALITLIHIPRSCAGVDRVWGG